MGSVNPKKIPGRWRDGYALDFHTISSTYLGDDEFGRAQFDTKRSDVGELLFQLKYRSDASAVSDLARAAATFIAVWKPCVDLIVPVPPTRHRDFQPVLLVAAALAEILRVPVISCVTRVREVPELKNVYEFSERNRLLVDSHEIDKEPVHGRRVLLFDDLYRSGATMNAISSALYDEGGAAEVFALTMTKTRTNQ